MWLALERDTARGLFLPPLTYSEEPTGSRWWVICFGFTVTMHPLASSPAYIASTCWTNVTTATAFSPCMRRRITDGAGTGHREDSVEVGIQGDHDRMMLARPRENLGIVGTEHASICDV